MIKWIIGGIIAIVIFYFASAFISVSNRDVVLRNVYTQKISERTAFYDKMWKIVAQKGQIAVRNDSSFQKNIQIIMEGRKDAPGTFMKWITESNPNANYDQVSILYQELSRTIEAEREGFYVREKDLQSVKLQHDNLVDIFPGSLVMWILGRSKLDYKPITSDRTDEVIKTGKDNNVSVF